MKSDNQYKPKIQL